jgi:cell wall-associated NlpC family hydrolase
MTIQLEEILATIRQRESGNDYAIKNRSSSASGAYQFIDSTWQGLLQRYAVEGPRRAADASPALQDYIAGRYVKDILNQHNGDIRAVPAVWYTGHFDPSTFDHVPAPGAGNSLTVGSYVAHWLEALDVHSPGYSGTGDTVVGTGLERPATGGLTPLDRFLTAALAQQGDSYVFGHEANPNDPNPDTFDCSELVQWAAAQAGVQLTDGSWLQYRSLSGRGGGMPVDEALRTPGALLFAFSGDPNAGGRPSRAHVAISLGDGRVMEARNPRKGVLISDASSMPWTHAAVIPELGSERSPGWPVTADLSSVPLKFGFDSDADGLLDEHERFIGSDPFAPDSDLDGWVDSLELQTNTDPLLAADNPLVHAGDRDYAPLLSFAAGGGSARFGGNDPYPAGGPPVPGQDPLSSSGGAGLEHLFGGGISPGPFGTGGSDPVQEVFQDAVLFQVLEQLASSNPGLESFLDQHGIHQASDIDRLPTSFNIDDWM